jgi:hypothetical protein
MVFRYSVGIRARGAAAREVVDRRIGDVASVRRLTGTTYFSGMVAVRQRRSFEHYAPTPDRTTAQRQSITKTTMNLVVGFLVEAGQDGPRQGGASLPADIRRTIGRTPTGSRSRRTSVAATWPESEPAATALSTSPEYDHCNGFRPYTKMKVPGWPRWTIPGREPASTCTHRGGKPVAGRACRRPVGRLFSPGRRFMGRLRGTARGGGRPPLDLDERVLAGAALRQLRGASVGT